MVEPNLVKNRYGNILPRIALFLSVSLFSQQWSSGQDASASVGRRRRHVQRLYQRQLCRRTNSCFLLLPLQNVNSSVVVALATSGLLAQTLHCDAGPARLDDGRLLAHGNTSLPSQRYFSFLCGLQVWEQNIGVVMMLTKEIESGVLKCPSFVPALACHSNVTRRFRRRRAILARTHARRRAQRDDVARRHVARRRRTDADVADADAADGREALGSRLCDV